MKTKNEELEKEFKQWLNERGYNYYIHYNDFKLWNEFIIRPSTYTQDELMDDCISSDNFFEEIDSKAIIKKRDEKEDAYYVWRMDYIRTLSSNDTINEMELYGQFCEQYK